MNTFTHMVIAVMLSILATEANALSDLDIQRINNECILRGSIYGSILQRRNMHVPKSVTTKELINSVEDKHGSYSTWNINLAVARPWINFVIDRIYNIDVDSTNVNPIEITRSFESVCLDNYEKYTRPNMIIWGK